jgi:YegS/Rv2252/BmrU family lipid kinase
MKAILIINPMSGKTKRKMPPILKWTFKKLKNRIKGISKHKITAEEIVEEVRIRCHKEKIKLQVEFTKYPKHAIELAKDAKDKYDLIIVAGGDGTVNEVINGMTDSINSKSKSKTTLVIMPFGSTNVLALELGIPFNVKEASELISNGKKIQIDLGHVKTAKENRYFSMMFGVGFDASLIKRISSKFKKRWGRLAYPLAGIRNIFIYTWNTIRVTHKFQSTGYFVIISNSKNYGGEYEIANKASPTDGLLDLVIIDRENWWKVIKFLFSVSSGRKSNKFLKGEYYQVKEAHISSKSNMLVQVDGELIGALPANVKVAPKALNIMVKK